MKTHMKKTETAMTFGKYQLTLTFEDPDHKGMKG